MSQLLRVQYFGVTQDGFGAGVSQSQERPFGDGANPGDLFSWAGATASWVNRTDPGGSRGLDDYFTRDYTRNIGAEIMGRNKFGPHAVRGRTRTGRDRGARPAVPHAGLRAHSSRAPVVHIVGHDLPLPRPRRPPKPWDKRRRPPTARTCASAAASQSSANSSMPTSSTRCTSPSRRSKSVAANACGRRPASYWTASISTPCRAPAA